MNYRTLGRTGIKVSEIGFGAWAIGGSWGEQPEKESIEALHKALDKGVNFIDTAQVYGDGRSERIIAKVLKERSEDITVATKTPPAPGPWPPSPYCVAEERFSEKYLRENIEERLRNLDTDCIDILQLHTWTRAWNNNPYPLEVLKKIQEEGKIRYFGISTPEDDQDSVIELMKTGLIDTVQVIYNIFDQNPAAELLPVAKEHNVGIIVRVVFDEGVLTGKYTEEHTFPEGDFRQNYFAGDRLGRAVNRVEKIKEDVKDTGYSMPEIAIRFALEHEAVSTIITGIRNVYQAESNIKASELSPLSEETMQKLRKHQWRRGFWYAGK